MTIEKFFNGKKNIHFNLKKKGDVIGGISYLKRRIQKNKKERKRKRKSVS